MTLAINSGPAVGNPRIEFLEAFENQVAVLRLDAVHPVVSGNKWYKLEGHLATIGTRQKVVTFGGAYSNHIVATAAACAALKLDAVGIIRGEQAQTLSPTLCDALAYGMQLHFTTRAEYREKKLPSSVLQQNAGAPYLLIPEGGYGPAGTEGIQRLAAQLPLLQFTHILCAVGTGTTLAGWINAALPGQQVIGISSQKNNSGLETATRVLVDNPEKAVNILHNYHFGGYARYNPQLIQFMNEWYRRTGVPSDFVYTAKLFYAFHDLWNGTYFPPQSKVLLVHSGGLQGNRSLPPGTLIF